MKKLVILLLLSLPMLAIGQQVNSDLLQGVWTLTDIQSKDSIWVAVNPNEQLPLATGKPADAKQVKMSVAAYMMKDLTCGITRFEFSGNTFKFYRQNELTFSGTYTTKNQTLMLQYNNGGGNTTKENTIVSITTGKLVLGSESKSKPVLLYFAKK